MLLKKELEHSMKEIIHGNTNEIQYFLQFFNFDEAMIASLLEDMKSNGPLSKELSSLFSSAKKAKAVQEAEGVRVDIIDDEHNKYSLRNVNGTLAIETFYKSSDSITQGKVLYGQTEYRKSGTDGNIRKLNTLLSAEYNPFSKEVNHLSKRFKATVSEFSPGGYELKRIEYNNYPLLALKDGEYRFCFENLLQYAADYPCIEKADFEHCTEVVKKYRANGIDHSFRDGFDILIPQIYSKNGMNDLKISSVAERNGALVSTTRTLIKRKSKGTSISDSKGIEKVTECEDLTYGVLNAQSLKKLGNPMFSFEAKEDAYGFLRTDASYRPFLYFNALGEISDPSMVAMFSRDINIRGNASKGVQTGNQKPARGESKVEPDKVDVDDPDVD